MTNSLLLTLTWLADRWTSKQTLSAWWLDSRRHQTRLSWLLALNSQRQQISTHNVSKLCPSLAAISSYTTMLYSIIISRLGSSSPRHDHTHGSPPVPHKISQLQWQSSILATLLNPSAWYDDAMMIAMAQYDVMLCGKPDRNVGKSTHTRRGTTRRN